MSQEITILSTKKLSTIQCSLFANNNIAIEHYDAISITKLPVLITDPLENVICSSSHTAQLLIDQKAVIKNIFCVGNKSASLFQENGYNVLEVAKNASFLAQKIVKHYRNASFLFFCGDKRREELPNILFENQINFSEIICYQTDLVTRKHTVDFDGILFFSPSGVQSFVLENNFSELPVFCIGETTAKELQKHTQNVIVSEDTSVEQVISVAINYFRS